MDATPHTGKDRIIFPLDDPSLDQARIWVERLRDEVGLFKVGLEFFLREGMEGLRAIEKMAGPRIFLDLKFHDIPQTVGQATAALVDSGLSIRMLTVHAAGGEAPIRAIAEKIRGDTLILGVTWLTSLEDAHLKTLGLSQDMDASVVALARVARQAGAAGIVCSSREVCVVKSKLGQDLICVVPGIRPEWGGVAGDDQTRTATPYEAISQGADYLVVGRPIRQASDPVQASRTVAEEIQKALSPSP